MKNNPIEKIRDLLAEPEARRKAAICAGLAAALAVGGAGIAIASNRPEPIDLSLIHISFHPGLGANRLHQ